MPNRAVRGHEAPVWPARPRRGGRQAVPACGATPQCPGEPPAGGRRRVRPGAVGFGVRVPDRAVVGSGGPPPASSLVAADPLRNGPPEPVHMASHGVARGGLPGTNWRPAGSHARRSARGNSGASPGGWAHTAPPGLPARARPGSGSYSAHPAGDNGPRSTGPTTRCRTRWPVFCICSVSDRAVRLALSRTKRVSPESRFSR